MHDHINGSIFTWRRWGMQVISLDIRDGGARSNNKRQGKALDSVGELFCFDFDGLKVSFCWIDALITNNCGDDDLINTSF